MAFQSSGTYKYPSSRHRSQPIQEWEKPRRFIETDDYGDLVVNRETVKCLEKITQPVVVVSVVGLYRTGKSFLLNRLSGLGQGFSIGATFESTTKGIWIWVVPHPKRVDCRLVLIDTEGLGDMAKAKLDHDIWIFVLAILLSGTLVYNSKGAIDQKAMNDLHLVTEIAERIKVKSDEGGNPSSGSNDDELKKFFPSFVWALRDCTLKLEINGKAYSPDEYLEYALTAKAPGQRKDIKGSDEQMVKHPKYCIKDYFPERRCFVFPFPVTDFDLMDRIDILEDCDLHKDFLKVTNEFCNYIFFEGKVKTIFCDITTGRALARLAVIYVESIRNGYAPCIQNAFESTAKIENEQALKESVDLYIKRFEASITFPTETQEEMCNCHQKCSRETFDFFLTKSVFDFDKLYYKQLEVKVEETYAQFRHTNEMKSEEACEKQLLDLYKKIEDTDYLFSGGYSKYEVDMQELVDTYEKTPHLKDVAAHVLHKFMKAREHTRQLILMADAKLPEAEKDQKAWARLAKINVETTAKIENEQAIKKSLDLYTKKFEASVKFPTENLKKMCDCHVKCFHEAFDFFMTKSVFDSDRFYYKQLTEKVYQTYAQFLNTNEMKSGEACEKQLFDLYQEIAAKDYTVCGGYNQYDKDMKGLADTYEKTPHLKDVAARVLKDFMESKEESRKLILKADKILSEAEKNQEGMEYDVGKRFK